MWSSAPEKAFKFYLLKSDDLLPPTNKPLKPPATPPNRSFSSIPSLNTWHRYLSRKLQPSLTFPRSIANPPPSVNFNLKYSQIYPLVHFQCRHNSSSIQH